MELKITNDYFCVADPEILKLLGPYTKEKMKKRNVHLSKKYVEEEKIKNVGKYNRKNAAHKLAFMDGCDLLQYNIVVRPFIIKKYNIENPLIFDALIYLYPIQFFTRMDFDELLLKYHKIYVTTLINLGFLKIAVASAGSHSDIYTLSDHAVMMVQEYYQYLSGEKVINPDNYTNPFKGQEVTKIDKMREKLMIKLKKQTKSSPKYYVEQLKKKLL